MSSSLIFDTLTRINERLTALEKLLTDQRHNPAAEIAEDVAALARLIVCLSADVAAYWYAHKRPITLRILSRNYSARLTPFGGIRALIPSLTGGVNSPVVALITLNGATLLFPREAYTTLTENELTVFTEMATDSNTLNRISETRDLLNRAAFDENIAENEAYAAFIGKQENLKNGHDSTKDKS